MRTSPALGMVIVEIEKIGSYPAIFHLWPLAEVPNKVLVPVFGRAPVSPVKSTIVQKFTWGGHTAAFLLDISFSLRD